MKKIVKSFFIAGVFLFYLSSLLPAQDFNKDLYAGRRQKLMETIKAGLVFIRNSEEQRKSNDEFYFPYKVNCDFYYLTGYNDPEAAMILNPQGKKKFILFVKPKNGMSSKWFGDVPGIDGAMKSYGADTAFAFNELEKVLPGLIYGSEKIYYDYNNEQIQKIVEPILNRFGEVGPKEIANISPIIHEMRLIKDEEEIKLLRKAVDITCDAHLEAIKSIKPGMYEYEIGAIFSFVFERNGALSKGFAPIIASGPNATIYHYSKQNRQTKNGELIMMDMGAEYLDYTADVTRVVPVNGRYTPEQKELYDVVLSMLEAVISNMKTGNSLSDCIRKSEEVALDGLFKLGLITDRQTIWQHQLYYFPYICHSIGLDIHDVGQGEDVILQPGMVFAVEPLLYVGDNLVDSFRMMAVRYYGIKESEVDEFLKAIKPAFEKYKGVAARVEDDVLITESGNEVLSSKLPRSTEEIEKLMSMTK